MARPDTSVVITGVGTLTAVGANAVQTAASVRAGINRFRAWPHFGVTLGTDDDGLPASFLPGDLGDGSWIDKWFDLVAQPLAEAICQAELEGPSPPARLATLIAVPLADRPGMVRAAFDAFVAELQESLPPPLDLHPVELVALGQAAGLAAVGTAVERLSRGEIDACVVCGIDSLLENQVLASLLEEQRLKTPTTSSGLIPGEGTGCVVLELAAAAKRRKVAPLARVAAVALDRDQAWRPDASIGATALSGCLRVVLKALEPAGGASAVINNVNGERWRFLEWALAETRCFAKMPAGWRLWHPADCLGDVGAAFGPIALALGVRAFARGYAGPNGIVVAASSDSGERGAVGLLPPTGVN